jgi:two-component system CheB/CheR fusion protein
MAVGIVNTVREPLLVLNSALQIVGASLSFYKTFKLTANEVIDKYIYDLDNKQWDIATLRNLLNDVLIKNKTFENYLVEHDFTYVGHKKILLNARRIVSKIEPSQLILLAMDEFK